MTDLVTSVAALVPTTSPFQLNRWVDDSLPVPGLHGVPDMVSQPFGTAAYLQNFRNATLAWQNLKPLIRLADSNLENLWELAGEMTVTAEELLTDTGVLRISVPWTGWLQDLLFNQTKLAQDINIIVDWNPLNPNWRTRWGGKVTEIHVKKDEKGIHTIDLTALHFREHAKRLLVAANPIFPPEIQQPRMWVLPGPARSICALTAFINLARLFVPGWSGIANGLNPFGWLNPLNPDVLENFLPTGWPIQVAFVDSALDQSRWTALGATWTTWHETFKDVLMDAGCCMKAYTYLTTDEDSPNTELAALLELIPDVISGISGLNLANSGSNVARAVSPIRNCVVFSFENVSGVTGPTGTVADGLLNTVAVTLDDLITPVVMDLGSGQTFDSGQVLNGKHVYDAAGVSQTYLVEQLTGVAPAPPKVIWWDGYYNGIVSSDLIYHKGNPKTVMTGSKSPIIVNEAQTFAIRYGLSQLQTVISSNLAGGIVESVGGAPQGAGLENLYQGQLDNSLFAWQRFTDPVRALWAGDQSWQEHFERGSGTAYTLSSILTLRSGNWKTRAFAAFQAETNDGNPWIANYDYGLGDRVGYEQDGVIYVDNVYGIKREWSWKKPTSVTCKVGEDRNKSEPLAAAFKTISTLYGFVSALAGEGTLFE